MSLFSICRTLMPLAAATVVTCATAGQVLADNIPLRIGVQGTVYLPVQSTYAFATDQGKYAEAGLDVEWVRVGTVADCARAVAGGSLEACMVEAFGAVNSAYSVPGLKMVAELTRGDFHYLVADPSIKTVKDLVGKKIGTGAPDSVHTLTGKALVRARGGNPDDSTWVSLGGTPVIIQSFLNKQVDAAMLVGPFHLVVPDATIIGNSGEVTPTYSVLLAKTDTDATTLEGLKRFLKVTLAETDYIIDPANEDAVVEAWAKWVKIDPSALKSVYRSYVDSHYWEDIRANKFHIHPEKWAAVAKLVNPNINSADLIDDSLQKATFE
ncbi:MAG: ABC transporter substrate-binding protein [Rhizobiaceae bacterium]|nr:ABC transporter substrate-binding protein [Rhizobiaceae bacterium]